MNKVNIINTGFDRSSHQMHYLCVQNISNKLSCSTHLLTVYHFVNNLVSKSGGGALLKGVQIIQYFFFMVIVNI